MPNVLILGSRGRLGAALVRLWSLRFHVTGLARPEIDMADPSGIPAVLDRHPADVVLDCTGLTSLEQCEEEPALAMMVNGTAPGVLARACVERGSRLIHFSTDYVFDGREPGLRSENDPANPLSVYGKSKLAGEEAVLAASADFPVFRVSWVFGPDKPSFVDMILQRALENDSVSAVADKESSPAFTHDIAHWVAPFLTGALPGGIYHACNSGTCSWQDFGQAALDGAARLGCPLRTRKVEPLRLADMASFRAERPRFTAMDCSRLETILHTRLRPWREALFEYLEQKFPPTGQPSS